MAEENVNVKSEDQLQIEEQSIINAEYDFNKINDFLDNAKKKVADIDIKKSDPLYLGSAVFVSGIYVGTKVPTPLRGLFRFASGVTLGYLGVKILRGMFSNKPAAAPAPAKTLTVEITPKEVEPKTTLENVRVLN